MLEERFARIENDVSELKADMKAVQTYLFEIEVSVSRLPGYVGLAAIIGGVSGLAGLTEILARYLSGAAL
jgi:hypothetical protein